MLVGVVEDVLAVGVVRGAERVGADPLQQGEVVDQVRVVVRLADDRVVLVHAESGELEGFAVDEELDAADLDGADADVLVDRVEHRARVVDQLDLEVIEVCRSRRPEVHVRNRECPVGRARLCGLAGDLVACGVAQDDSHIEPVLVDRLDAPVDRTGRTLEAGDDGEVLDPGLGRRRQPHRTVDPRVVEEVVPVDLRGATRALLDDTRRDALEAQGVVDEGGDEDLVAGRDEFGDVGLERGVATFVAHDLVLTHPDGGAVRGRLEVEDDALAVPPAGHADGALIPDVAEVVLDRGVGRHVVEAGRHGHVTGIGERGGIPTLGTADRLGVEPEGPDAVKVLALSGAGVLGAEHEGPFGVRCRDGTTCGGVDDH